MQTRSSDSSSSFAWFESIFLFGDSWLYASWIYFSWFTTSFMVHQKYSKRGWRRRYQFIRDIFIAQFYLNMYRSTVTTHIIFMEVIVYADVLSLGLETITSYARFKYVFPHNFQMPLILWNFDWWVFCILGQN